MLLQIENDETTPAINWPTAQASFGTVEDGILVSKPDQVPRPAASTAKLITALTVLKEKPLLLDESGPLLTMTTADMALYNRYYAANGSLVAIQVGQQLSQYQMLQGILIRSGNNLADSLAIWAFGSLEAYQKAAQQYVNELGMTSTTVGLDASGLSPTTTSTADDLTRLGIAAMKHDVVREIVRQPVSNLPVDGNKPNTNWMLGQNGTVGIKTGSLPSIGGVFIIASEYTPEGEQPIMIVGAVQGAPTTYTAIAESGQLAEALKAFFVRRTVIKKGTVVATIVAPWGETSDVVTSEDITTFGWKYKHAEPNIELRSDVPFTANAVLGQVSVGEQSTELIATNPINLPSWQWRVKTSR